MQLAADASFLFQINHVYSRINICAVIVEKNLYNFNS